MTQRVVVGMSGGVDSSVAAALLLDAGFEVVGLTLKLWTCQPDEVTGGCCGAGAATFAARVADALGIEHHVVDQEAVFTSSVLRRAWDEYHSGRTPNPCVLCNQHVKFTALRGLADRLDAGFIATGHHARVVDGPRLLRGRDRAKDQSYFLFSVDPDTLARTRFPVGELTKSEVRALARERGLPSAEQEESQDACFTHRDGSFAEALRIRFGGPHRPGAIRDSAGLELGEHRGIHRYTIGQRKGLGVAAPSRLYVSGIDACSNTVQVTDDPDDLLARSLVAADVRWLRPPSGPFHGQVQIRYRTPEQDARIEPESDDPTCARVTFAEPMRAVTPGQVAVFYLDDECLGGGWIREIG